MSTTQTTAGVNNTSLTGQIIRVAAGVAILTASAKIQVPFLQVPMTLQIAAIMLIGATMGARMAVMTLVAYMATGAAGLPVFAGTPEKGVGLAYMMGTTGGYLAGFVAAAGIVGFAADRLPKFTVPVAMLAGLAAIYVLGLAWLATFAPDFKTTLAWGFTPFIVVDLVKVAIAAVAFYIAPKALLEKIRGGTSGL